MNECTLCEGTGRLIDNITGREYVCRRCLGTGVNIMKTVTNIIIPKKKPKERSKND